MLRQILFRTGLLLTGIALGVFVFGPGIVEGLQNTRAGPRPAPPAPEAQALHARLVVADLHAGSLLWGRDLLQWGERGHVDLPRLEAGNVALQVFATVTRATGGIGGPIPLKDPLWTLGLAQRWPWGALSDPMARAAFFAHRLERLERRAKGRLKIVRTAHDLEALLMARADGQQVTGALLAAEGAHPLEGGAGSAQALFASGYRVVALSNGADTAYAGGIKGPGGGGLTDLGRSAVGALEAAGLVVDVAGTSPQAARAVLELATRPLLVSSTALAGTCPGAPALPVEILAEIAAQGGLIGIAVAPEGDCGSGPEAMARSLAEAAKIFGAGSVALGSDFDGRIRAGFDASELAALTGALLAEGLSEPQIGALMGGNAVRFLRDMLPVP